MGPRSLLIRVAWGVRDIHRLVVVVQRQKAWTKIFHRMVTIHTYSQEMESCTIVIIIMHFRTTI
jgi:hypothetical protein